jgi:hypothetical protein
MDNQSSNPEDPRWLDEFEELANRELEEGSSCEQVHPIIERWFEQLLAGDPPPSRPSVAQATACLATEVLYNLPDDMFETLVEKIGEDEAALWVEHILLVGRAFEIALRGGDLDDL